MGNSHNFREHAFAKKFHDISIIIVFIKVDVESFTNLIHIHSKNNILNAGKRVCRIFYFIIGLSRFDIRFGTMTSVLRKMKRSDSVQWQKPLHPHTNPKSNLTTQKRNQKLRLQNDCGLRTVNWSNNNHPTGVVKPVYKRSTLPLTATDV